MTASHGSIDEFCGVVETETSHSVTFIDDGVGDLCWFGLDGIPLKIDGEEFESEVHFNLSRDSVDVVIAEMESDGPITGKRRLTLDAKAEKIEKIGEKQALYEYSPENQQVEPLLSQLREIHSRVFE